MSRMFMSLFITLSAIVAVGCTSQPLSPTGLAGASEITASMPRALTDESPVQSAAGGRPATSGAVFVTSQGLYYDTFVARDPLPMKGKFQLLVNGMTEFGPGDPGYLGGRWWEDLNGNGVQDEGDHFFLCPLLGPGRTTP